ncbi:hypothetical protein [Lacrimispora sp.]|uniref:hypothetical protein n=1 Tax=Lacrimispora sp. TaxID=2719234 RepID=UPI0032E4E8C5
MGDKLNLIASSEMAIASVAVDDNFNKLTETSQTLIINGINENKAKEGGFMGKLFGTKPENVSMHIAFTLCIILLLYCGIDLVGSVITGRQINSELWNTIIPVVTLALGFIFGKGIDKS